MADENHDDADEPVIPGTHDEVAAADASVSVAPFIDDDDDDDDTADSGAAGDDDTSASDDAGADRPTSSSSSKATSSKSAVGAAVASSTAASGKKGRKPSISDDAADAEGDGPKVTRRVVTSKRVTPKGGAAQKPSGPKKAKGQKPSDDEGFRSARYTPPGGQGAYAQGPSPWWVPALLFGFLIVGALIIMLNYMGVFGDAQNLRLVIGLAFILAGILTSTQYR